MHRRSANAAPPRWMRWLRWPQRLRCGHSLSVASALALGGALLACPGALSAQAAAPRALSFDTRYVVGTYSNEAWADFGLEALDLVTWPAEAITLQGGGGNLMRGILLVAGTDFLARTFKLSYHEFGHGTRAAAVGFRPFFGYGESPTRAELDEIRASGGLRDDFLSYFLGSFFETAGYTALPDGEVLFTPLEDSALAASGWDLTWRAAGLNNEMFLTERLEQRLQRGGAHAGMLSTWVRGKISTIRYAGGKRIGDVEAILGWYGERGYDVEREDLHRAGFISLLLSTTTYELVYRTGRVLAGDPIRYEPWAPYGIELPNIGFYMTTAGVSYRVNAGYRRGRWRFPVAVEHVMKGLARTEVSLGGEWGPAPYYLATRLTLGEQVEAAASVNRLIRDRFLVSAGYTLYDTRNLHGERMIPSLESGPRYHDVFLRVGVVY